MNSDTPSHPATPPNGATPKPRRNAATTPQQVTLKGRILARLIWMLVRGLSATIRWSYAPNDNAEKSLQSGQVIFAVWHNRLALCFSVYRRYMRDRVRQHRQLAGLVSASRDGGLLTRVIELFDAKPVRGSSSRRGAQALIELRSAAAAGYDLAITPDGPRGPLYTVQEGIITLAQVTGCPIVPVAYWMGWKVVLRSWDRFQIPLPFSRCCIQFGEPIYVPADAGPEDRERFRAELEKSLRAITHDGREFHP